MLITIVVLHSTIICGENNLVPFDWELLALIENSFLSGLYFNMGLIIVLLGLTMGHKSTECSRPKKTIRFQSVVSLKCSDLSDQRIVKRFSPQPGWFPAERLSG
jgi:hypothetical protein